MQQQALEVNLREVANTQGFELLHMSHRHHPVVEFSIHMRELDSHRNPVRLRSEVCRLLRAACARVGVESVRPVSSSRRSGRLRPRLGLAIVRASERGQTL